MMMMMMNSMIRNRVRKAKLQQGRLVLPDFLMPGHKHSLTYSD
jgi:hypothetical protein